jgi:hypothetical protein
MTLPKYLSYWEDIYFAFSLKFVLAWFKCIPAEFKYRRDCNGLNIQFCTLTKTDARIHFTSYVFMYLCLHKTDFFQMYIGGFGGRKYKNWTDHLVPKGDFVLQWNKEICTTFLNFAPTLCLKPTWYYKSSCRWKLITHLCASLALCNDFTQLLVVTLMGEKLTCLREQINTDTPHQLLH